MRGIVIFSAVALAIVAVAWLRKRQTYTAAAATLTPAVSTANAVVQLMPVLEAPETFSLQSGDAAVTIGKAAMQLTNVWHFNPKKISTTLPFPLQTIEVRYGLSSAGVDSLGYSTELSPGESFVFHDTIFTLLKITLPPQKRANNDAFTAGGGTVEITTKQALRKRKDCPLGEWVRLSLAEVCAIENGPKFSVWRLGANRARLAKESNSGELRHWLTFDLGVASDETWNFRGRNFDVASGSIEVMVTQSTNADASTATPLSFNKPFWFAIDLPYIMPGGFQLATHGVEITRYGTLGLHWEATKLDQDAAIYADAHLYRYTGADDDESSTKGKSFTLCGRSYTLSISDFRQTTKGPEVQLKLTKTELPKFSYEQPFSLESGQATFMGFRPQFIEGPQGEVLGCLGESHRHGRDDKRLPATWGWIDFQFFTQSKTYHLHLPNEQFQPGYVWKAGHHSIEVIQPHTQGGVELRVTQPPAERVP